MTIDVLVSTEVQKNTVIQTRSGMYSVENSVTPRIYRGVSCI